MKTLFARMILAVAGAVSLGGLAHAGPPPALARAKTFSGVTTLIDQNDKTIAVGGFWGTRRFRVAADCVVTMPGYPAATLADLRLGQRLEVGYESAQGVLIAYHIAQEPMTFSGNIQSLDQTNHEVTVRHRGLDMTFKVPPDCKMAAAREVDEVENGVMAALQRGDRVTVTYETPSGADVAREIRQDDRSFTDSIVFIDPDSRTLKAKSYFGEREFNLARGCEIVIDGKSRAKVGDLRPGDMVAVNYTEEGGALVADRVGRETNLTETPPIARTTVPPDINP